MNLHEYKKLAEMEDYYWWHVGRKTIIKGQIKSLGLPPSCKILNVGCGTGGTVEVLERFGEVVNIDISDAAVEFSRLRGIKNIIKADACTLPFADDSFDLVIGLDILEHMRDDRRAIAEWRRVLKTGGHLLLTVPAYQWLWSEHDESLHHFRRYTLTQMRRLVEPMQVRKKSYIVVLTFLPIVLYRFFQRLLKTITSTKNGTSYVILPAILNNLLIKFLEWEGACLSHMNFPFGTSIIITAVK